MVTLPTVTQIPRFPCFKTSVFLTHVLYQCRHSCLMGGLPHGDSRTLAPSNLWLYPPLELYSMNRW